MLQTRPAEQRSERGKAAESQALALLERAGLTLVTRNYRCRGGELDLVMRKGNLLVIVEVRQRSRGDYGGAAASITTRKQARIIHATQMFLAQNPEHARRVVRFDAVTFEADGRPRWIKAAFDASR